MKRSNWNVMAVSAALLTGLTATAQNAAEQTFINPKGQTVTVSKAVAFRVTPPARDWPVIQEKANADFPDKQKAKGHNKFKKHEVTNPNALPANGLDPVWQQQEGNWANRAPLANFNGQNGETPPDPTGAAGLNYYVQAVNVSYRIYNKNGGNVAGPFSLNNLWPGTTNEGDPIVMYDRHADRWFISQFNDPANILIAVSETSDPAGSYYSWNFSMGQFPDYPKFSIWWDGYYMTSNSSNTAVVFERDKMLNGDAGAQMVRLSAPNLGTGGFRNILPADADGDLPANGTPCYFFNLEDDSWSGVSSDAIKVYEMNVDWNNTSNTAITVSQTLNTQAFSTDFGFGFSNIEQPGSTQKLDAVSQIFYYRAQYMRWAGYNSIVLCHVVDVDNTDHAGIRWYELRDQDDGNWSIYQQGTYAPDNGNRWLGSIAMDNQGNIGLAYSHNNPSANLHSGIRYTGRMAGDPLGQMTVAEETVVDGGGALTGTNRYGDYGHMALDPDGETLWFTGEWLNGAGSSRTRIFSFRLAGNVGIENPYYKSLEMNAVANNGQLQVQVNGLKNNEPVMLELWSADGKILHHSDVFPQNRGFLQNIPVHHLAAGTYLVRTGNAGFQKVLKTVVQ